MGEKWWEIGGKEEREEKSEKGGGRKRNKPMHVRCAVLCCRCALRFEIVDPDSRPDSRLEKKFHHIIQKKEGRKDKKKGR